MDICFDNGEYLIGRIRFVMHYINMWCWEFRLLRYEENMQRVERIAYKNKVNKKM